MVKQKVKKQNVKYSIRLKLSFVLLSLTAGICMVYILVNQFFLEDYYISTKQENLLEGHNVIRRIVNKEEVLDEESSQEIVGVCEKYGIIMIMVDTSGELKFLYGNGDILKKRLLDINFGINPPDYEVIENTTEYVLAGCNLNTDSIDAGYLELSGFFNTDNIFLMRMPVESITESVKISMQFYAKIGLGVCLVGILIAYLGSREITKPILKLAEISEEMSKLNFNIKYDGTSDDELGILGNSMNELSDKLESTIIELKQANASLRSDIQKKEQIDEMRKEFIANVSHELKTPIALIQGYAEGLKECINDDEESREYYCSVIIDEADKMNKMVKNLLSLNQLEFGDTKLEYERFDINPVIRGVVSSLEYMTLQYGVQITFLNDAKAEPLYVYADEFKIEQVITNYLTNAIHYAAGEKLVRVTAVKQQNNVRVSVFNTGSPILEEDLDNVWIKFYKVDKARTREYGGSGIGLSIVKAIMNAHDKEYGVINHDDGVEFWFELDA